MSSPVKWLTNQQYSNLPIFHKAMANADSQVGVKETGINKGKQVEEYQETAGLGKGGGNPWCACFVYWCLIQSGANPGRLPQPGICAAVRNWASWAKGQSKIQRTPKRGHLFYWLKADQTGHMGFCIGPSILGIFRTIEGNTDGESGSREGDGVHKRTRTIWQLKSHKQWGFIDLRNL
ncbi:MAG: CHAP domain-containing protein [Fimbriimonadaceae bacterium]